MGDHDNILDDLGAEKGKVEIPYAHCARDLARQHPPCFVGTRPQDHAQRDLLIGGWLRDNRLFGFRQLIKNKDPRFYCDTWEFTDRERDDIARCRAFYFFYLAAIYRFREVTQHDDQSDRIFHDLFMCPPTLLGFDSDRLNRGGFRACDRPSLCPYCMSRSATDVYDLLGGEFGRSSERCLVLAVATIDSSIDSRFGLSGTDDIQITHRIIQSARRQLRQSLQTHFGVSGGMWVTTSGPCLRKVMEWEDGELRPNTLPGLETRIAMLAEARADCVGEKLPANYEDLRPQLLPDLEYGPLAVTPVVTIRCTADEDGLRALLFGQSPSKRRPGNAVAGAFNYAPWHLANSTQWEAHVATSQGMPLYRYWGDWIGRFEPAARRPSPMVGLPNLERRRRENSRRNLSEGNARRHQHKDQRLTSLEELVLPVWDDLLHRFGGPPGRVLLRKVASDAGISITEREARGFVERFSRQSQQ